MNFLRWLSFWPVSNFFGRMSAMLTVFVGGNLLGHWPLTAFLVLMASAFIQPVLMAKVASRIVPRMNNFVIGSIFAPYILTTMYVLLVYTHLLSTEPFLASMISFYSLTAGWTILATFFGFALGTLCAISLCCEVKRNQESPANKQVASCEQTIYQEGGAAEAA